MISRFANNIMKAPDTADLRSGGAGCSLWLQGSVLKGDYETTAIGEYVSVKESLIAYATANKGVRHLDQGEKMR